MVRVWAGANRTIAIFSRWGAQLGVVVEVLVENGMDCGSTELYSTVSVTCSYDG